MKEFTMHLRKARQGAEVGRLPQGADVQVRPKVKKDQGFQGWSLGLLQSPGDDLWSGLSHWAEEQAERACSHSSTSLSRMLKLNCPFRGHGGIYVFGDMPDLRGHSP